MRRFWIVSATLVMTMGLAATAATATAAGAAPTGRASAVSCPSLINRYQKVSSSAAGFNPSNPTSFQQVINNAISELNYLANNAPKQLRNAFKDLAKLYAPLKNVKLSNPASLSQLETFATSPRFQSDIHQIETYFASICHFRIPTT